MAELVYSAGLTSKLFWLQESRKTAGYILDGYSKADIRKIAWEENIYQVKAEYRAYEVLNGTYRRVSALPEAVLRAFTTCDVETAKILNLIAILMDSRLFFEFLHEVYDEKLRLGEKEITEEAYEELLEQVSASKEADLIDAELFCGDERMKRIVKKAHENEVFVVASNHDFFKTPAKEEIIGRLKKMQELDADIAKIAVMPQSRQDVLVLLDATREMYETYARGPIVTMSMGQMGAVSRIAGEVFGSSITFGAAGKASAPGQIEVGALRNALLTLHGGL